MAVGQINSDADTFDDLAVGVPGLEVSGHPGAGGVAVFYGSPTGLHFATLLTQATPGVPGSPQSGAHFGAALAFEADPLGTGTAQLRIGEPGLDLAHAKDAGGFVDLTWANGALSSSGTSETTLASTGIPGQPQAGDQLGAALSERLAVGAPGRTVGGHPGAGAVLVTLPPRPAQLITQDSPGMPGHAERNDRFGAALSGQWVGIPGESVGPVVDAGAVERWDLDDPDGRILLTQDSPEVPGKVEAGDHFGAALAELGVYIDDVSWSPRELVIGSPGEDLGSVRDAGSATVLGEFDDPASGPLTMTGDDAAFSADTVGSGARFGSSLARSGDSSLLVGAPDVDGGRVTALIANGFLPASLHVWAQQAGTPEAGDAYGRAVAPTGR